MLLVILLVIVTIISNIQTFFNIKILRMPYENLNDKQRAKVEKWYQKYCKRMKKSKKAVYIPPSASEGMLTLEESFKKTNMSQNIILAVVLFNMLYRLYLELNYPINPMG